MAAGRKCRHIFGSFVVLPKHLTWVTRTWLNVNVPQSPRHMIISVTARFFRSGLGELKHVRLDCKNTNEVGLSHFSVGPIFLSVKRWWEKIVKRGIIFCSIGNIGGSWRRWGSMLIGPFHCDTDIKILFKLFYWSTQWFSVSALSSLSTTIKNWKRIWTEKAGGPSRPRVFLIVNASHAPEPKCLPPVYFSASFIYSWITHNFPCYQCDKKLLKEHLWWQ